MNNFKILDLIKDRLYQEEYNQDERYYLFNKYQINSIEPFFMPIHYLSAFILSHFGKGTFEMKYSYGHGQSILNNFFHLNAQKTELKSQIIQGGEKYNQAIPSVYKDFLDKEFLSFIPKQHHGFIRVRFWFKKDKSLSFKERFTITIDCKNGSLNVPKTDVYPLIEEWLKDFKFIK